MARKPPSTDTENQPFSVGSALPGASPGAGMGAYGGVPTIPNPIFSQGAAIGGDIGQFPAFSNLAQMYNLANYGTQAQEVAGTPGFASVLSNLQGQIPQDVKNQLIQGAAERGVSTGTIGSPNADAALLQSLGLTSLDLQKLGQEQYGSLLGHFPMAAPFDMQAFMTSPEQYQAALTAANVNAAAPNPDLAAQAELDALLKAIEAGKAGGPKIPGLPPPGGGPSTTTPPGGPGAGGATTPPPPVIVTGGGYPQPAPPESFWDYWKKAGPSQPPPSGGPGGGPGGGGTYPGFGPGGSPSQKEWDDFTAALNPNATAANTWFGMTPDDLAFLNSFQSPGFGSGSPTPGEWEGFLSALNPGAAATTKANTWFGMTPDELNMVFGSAPDKSAPASDWAQFESEFYNQMLEPDPASTPADTYAYDQGYGDYYDTGP